MSETNLTKKMKRHLYIEFNRTGKYPAFEVTLGEGYGDERVDFVLMDSQQIFKCYEIKSSIGDLISGSKLSFCGDYNYFVMPKSLYDNPRARSFLGEYVVNGVGVYLFDEDNKEFTLRLERKAKKKSVPLWKRTELMCCMIRSLSRDAGKWYDYNL